MTALGPLSALLTGCRTDACPVVSVPYADPALARAAITVDADPAAGPARPSRLRPVELTGDVALRWTGAMAVWDPDGHPLVQGDTVSDATILIGATSPGRSVLSLTAVRGCRSGPAELVVDAVEPAPIAVSLEDGSPGYATYDLFGGADSVYARIDERYADRIGLEADVYAVPHRQWSAGAPIDGVPTTAAVGPEPVELGSGFGSDAVVATPYDLVVDFGRDGRVDPGDLVDGLDGPGFVVASDLSAPGPYPVVTTELSQSYWITMRVYHPQLDLVDPSLLPMPLVVISHGNGHDYTWYDYLGEHLASYGYTVIAHRNDTQPGPVSAAATTLDNTDAFLAGLATFEGGALDGKVSPHDLALVGHSRGGEGVLIAYDQLVDGESDPAQFGAADVKLLVTIAPTAMEDPLPTPRAVPYHLIAGAADGDVDGILPTAQYFRFLQGATGRSAVTYVQGADHNDFDCCGPNDADWTAGGPGVEIGRTRAQQVARSYLLAHLEAQFRGGEVGHEALWEYLARAPDRFRPDSVDAVISSQLERADGDGVTVIDDFQTAPSIHTSSSGGAVTATVRALAEGALDDADDQLQDDPADPFNGMTQSDHDADPARGVTFEWDEGDDGATLEFELPEPARDLRGQQFLSLRACQQTRHPNTVALADEATFSVALVDAAGATSVVGVEGYGGIPAPYARNGEGAGTGWVNEFQTLRIPLDAFTAGGGRLDRSEVVAVRLLFGPSWGSPIGRLGLDDLELLAPGAP